MRIVCVSDTHLRAFAVPEGDLLIHAGDGTMQGSEQEVAEFGAWLRDLPHRHKVVIAGNHDFLFQEDPAQARRLLDGVTYLEDSVAEVAGLRIYGSPWQPWFYDWAFNLRRGAEIKSKWDLIPAGLDILVTHGPPFGTLDRTIGGQEAGCEELLTAVERLQPRVHVFGHIHEAYGSVERGGTLFVNASVCTRRYLPRQPPIVLEWDAQGLRLAAV